MQKGQSLERTIGKPRRKTHKGDLTKERLMVDGVIRFSTIGKARECIAKSRTNHLNHCKRGKRQAIKPHDGCGIPKRAIWIMSLSNKAIMASGG